MREILRSICLFWKPTNQPTNRWNFFVEVSWLAVFQNRTYFTWCLIPNCRNYKNSRCFERLLCSRDPYEAALCVENYGVSVSFCASCYLHLGANLGCCLLQDIRGHCLDLQLSGKGGDTREADAMSFGSYFALLPWQLPRKVKFLEHVKLRNVSWRLFVVLWLCPFF
jgi:hypothetical protein